MTPCIETSLGRPVIIHQTEDLVVVNKPAGMPTHPGPGCRPGASLMTWLRQHTGRWVYPVHRLDAPVSGALVMALSPSVASQLAGQFAGRCVDKTYVGIARGWLPAEGTMAKPLGRLDESDAPVQEPQEAITLYKTLAQWDIPLAVRPYPRARYSLLELKPLTGRTHQLRRHLAGQSHPLIGDTRYGDGEHNRAFRTHFNCHRLLLHARHLAFDCPATGKRMTFSACFDQSWALLMGAEGFSNSAAAGKQEPTNGITDHK